MGNGYVKMQFDRLLLLVDTAENGRSTSTRAESARRRWNALKQYLARAGETKSTSIGPNNHAAGRANRLKVAGKV